MTISCIIPFYNEGERLYTVMDEIAQVKNFLEVILVDDASEKDQSAEILKRYPNVKLIRLKENQGKTGAIREGLKKAQGELIMLFDADLRNVDHKEVESANEAILKRPNIDMLILRQVDEPRIIKMLRGDVLVTGERILRKNDLEEILENKVDRWELESAINHYMHQRKKIVYWIPFSGRNTYKPFKWGLNNYNLIKDIQTQKDIWTGAGRPINLISHYLFFGREELKVTATHNESLEKI
jgi:glycosyltransferase involved in cell wall biosynthesis